MPEGASQKHLNRIQTSTWDFSFFVKSGIRPPSGEAASYVNGKRPGIFHSEKFILAPGPLVLLAIGRQSHGIAKMIL